MIELKTANEIATMREAGKVVAAVHTGVRAEAAVGVTLKALDDLAHDIIRSHGAGSSFLGYHPHFAPTPYPGVINASVNDAMLHGIPTKYRLRDGDLLSIDCGAYIDGWHADAAISFVVGRPRPEDLDLIKATEDALAAGIDAAQPGSRMGDIGHAISAAVKSTGFGMQNDFVGHGIGRAMHEEPPVPNKARPGRGLRLRPGLVIAIEPSLMAGGDDGYAIGEDGWSIMTGDGSRGAHAEHTVAITDDGPMILTLP